MNTREAMDAALKNVVVPRLRNLGYTGSMPHFRRLGPRVDLITFQFDKWGGGFTIEIGSASNEGFTTYWGKFIPPEKLKAWDLNVQERHRLTPLGNPGAWFRFDGDPAVD